MEKVNFEALASKYDLTVDFLNGLYEKVADKENFVRAVKMFADGRLPYGVATGTEPINVAAIRHQIAVNLLERRKKWLETLEKEREKREYLDSCGVLWIRIRGEKEMVWIDNGMIVAFGHFSAKDGGIYACNAPVLGEFQWNPHRALGRLRKLNKAFYRSVKKAAFASPKEWFDFNLK